MRADDAKKYKMLFTGIFVALFAAAYFAGSLFIRKSKAVSIGADFMPKLYAVILLLLAACLIYQGIREARRFVGEENNNGERKDTKNVLLTFVLIIAYIAVMELIGFMLSSAIFLFLMSMLLTPADIKRNYKMALLYSVILSIGAYLLFHNVMFMPLPVGVIFGG